MNYVYAYAALCKGACVLDSLREVDDDYELLRGVPRAQGFPSAAAFDMDSDFGMKYEDVLKNTQALLVVSEKMKRILEASGIAGTEVLPVTVHDLKKRPIGTAYFILHQVPLQDCVDLSKTIAVPNPMDPTMFITVDKIAIDETRVDPDVRIFRPKEHPEMVVFRRDFAEHVLASGCRGIAFGEIAEYDELMTL